MFIRTTQQIIHGEDIKWKHSWLPKENISPHLSMAVIASEDNRFAEHNGFDFKEIEKALKETRTENALEVPVLSANRQPKTFSCGLLLLGSGKDLKCISPP